MKKEAKKAPKYIFVVTREAPPEKEEEYLEWYGKEQAPALLKVPGVISVNRYVSIGGTLPGQPTRKFMAVYELKEPSAWGSPAWRKATDTERGKKIRPLLKTSEHAVYERMD